VHIYGHLCHTTVWLGLGVCELLHLFLALLVLGLAFSSYDFCGFLVIVSLVSNASAVYFHPF